MKDIKKVKKSIKEITYHDLDNKLQRILPAMLDAIPTKVSDLEGSAELGGVTEDSVGLGLSFNKGKIDLGEASSGGIKLDISDLTQMETIKTNGADITKTLFGRSVLKSDVTSGNEGTTSTVTPYFGSLVNLNEQVTTSLSVTPGDSKLEVTRAESESTSLVSVKESMIEVEMQEKTGTRYGFRITKFGTTVSGVFTTSSIKQSSEYGPQEYIPKAVVEEVVRIAISNMIQPLAGELESLKERIVALEAKP